MLNKLEKYIFYFLIFAIPFQVRKILWYPDWRFVEWNSISIYGTDILLGALIIFWLFNSYSKLAIYNLRFTNYFKTSIFKKADCYLVLFLLISAISIKNSGNIIIGWYQWLKLLEFVVFYFYLKYYAIYRFGFSNTLFAVFCGGILQGLIATAQFLKQENIGLKYLGESIFNIDMAGVASFYLPTGEKIIRVYGATPHPNVLAAYLFLALFCFYFIWFYKRTKYDNWFLAAHLATLWGFFLTFSRVALFLLVANFFIRGSLLFFKFKKLKSKRVWKLLFYSGMIVVVFVLLYWPAVITRLQISGDEDAVQIRNFYNRESLKTISWFGTGMGDSVSELMQKAPLMPSYMYQPIHNIYLLIFSETGILGITTFVLFLAFLFRDFIVRTGLERFHHYSLVLVLSSFLFMGLFDHFLWTLQQGRFLLWLVLASLTINENDDIM